MIAAVADNHAALWYLFDDPRLSVAAFDELAAVLGEAEHLFTEAPFTAGVVQSMRRVSRAEVPEMPDRMIAATAEYPGVPILSRDRRIRSASLRTIW